MILDTYRVRLAQLAEDLINTYDTFLEEPEHLRTPADLQRFLRQHSISGEVDDAVLTAVRVLRDQLRAAWTGENTAAVMAILNPLLADAHITPRLVADEQDANTCRLIYQMDPALPLIDRLTFESAFGISAILQGYGLDRMRACDAEPCRDVFVDTSRNRSRRFCSDRCANRYNVQSFRARKQE